MRHTNDSGRAHLVNVDRRVSKVEELVYSRNDNGEKQAEDPSTNCRRRHGGIVSVGYRGSNFGVRGFIFKSDGGRVKVGIIDEVLWFSTIV